MKKWLQRLFIFVFIFAFVFGDFANTGVFSKGTLQVQAADTIKDYKETGHKLHSNTDMGAVAIDEVGHKSTTPFRKFVMVMRMMVTNVSFAAMRLGVDIRAILIQKK